MATDNQTPARPTRPARTGRPPAPSRVTFSVDLLGEDAPRITFAGPTDLSPREIQQIVDVVAICKHARSLLNSYPSPEGLDKLIERNKDAQGVKR